MKDIEHAIRKESEYIKDVLNMQSQDTRPELINYINQAGYNDIEEFHRDKRRHIINSIQFIDWELTCDEITLHLSDICEYLCENNEFCIFYNIDMPYTCAFVPDNFNKENDLKELGIKPIFGKYKSNENKGIIITGNGDLKFAMSIPCIKSDILNIIAERIVEYLGNYYDNIYFSGNDILINNKKVVGFATRKIGNMMIVMFNMTFNEYSDIINKVCVYTDDKIPGFIDNININSRIMLNEIKSWLQIEHTSFNKPTF